MKRLSLVTCFVFVVTIFAGPAVFAQGKHGEKHGKKGHHKMKMHKKKMKHHMKNCPHKKGHKKKSHFKKLRMGLMKLDLSEGQKNRIHELKFDWKLEKIELKAQKKKEKVRLHRMKKRDSVDREAFNEQIQALFDAKAEYKKELHGFMMDVKDVLTPEQKKELKSAMMKHGKHHKRGHGQDAKRKEHGDSEEESYF